MQNGEITLKKYRRPKKTGGHAVRGLTTTSLSNKQINHTFTSQLHSIITEFSTATPKPHHTLTCHRIGIIRGKKESSALYREGAIWKLTVAKLNYKFAFLRFNDVFTKVLHMSLSWKIHVNVSHWYQPLRILQQNLVYILFCRMHPTRFAHLFLCVNIVVR